MTQYIDKEKVEDILRNLWKKDDGTNPEHRICYNKALQEVQCELDTLEAKKVDLEKEVKRWKKERCIYGMDEQDFVFAKHFYELGLKEKGE